MDKYLSTWYLFRELLCILCRFYIDSMSVCSVPVSSGVAPISLGLCSKCSISVASVISPVMGLWPVPGQRPVGLKWALDSDTGVTLFFLKNYEDVSDHLGNPVMRTCLNMKLIQGRQRQDMETNSDKNVWPPGSSHAWSHKPTLDCWLYKSFTPFCR